jgi:hypothetical protein
LFKTVTTKEKRAQIAPFFIDETHTLCQSAALSGLQVDGQATAITTA